MFHINKKIEVEDILLQKYCQVYGIFYVPMFSSKLTV